MTSSIKRMTICFGWATLVSLSSPEAYTEPAPPRGQALPNE